MVATAGCGGRGDAVAFAVAFAFGFAVGDFFCVAISAVVVAAGGCFGAARGLTDRHHLF